MYVRTFPGSYAPATESHFVLYDCDVPAEHRRATQPWGWYLFPVWESIGQQAANFEYVLPDFVEVLRHQVVSHHGPITEQAHRRMAVLGNVIAPVSATGIVVPNGKGYRAV